MYIGQVEHCEILFKGAGSSFAYFQGLGRRGLRQQFTLISLSLSLPSLCLLSSPPRVSQTPARMRSVGAREEARDSARLREAAEIQERERRRRLEKRQLMERNRDLKQTVSELERQVSRRLTAASWVRLRSYYRFCEGILLR